MRLRSLLLVPLLASVVACSGLPQLSGNREARAAVQYTIAILIREGKVDADRVIDVGEEVQNLVGTGAVTTVLGIRDFVLSIIELERYPPEDQIVINFVIDGVADELIELVGDGVIPADRRLEVNEVVGWAVDAARLYGQGSS